MPTGDGIYRTWLLFSSDLFDGKLAFYQVNENYDYESANREYQPVYHTCLQKVDCDYLSRFFHGQNLEPLERYTRREDRFYIEIPVVTNAARYVLLFESWNNYGKIGS